jgi:hypothetical protein
MFILDATTLGVLAADWNAARFDVRDLGNCTGGHETNWIRRSGM